MRELAFTGNRNAAYQAPDRRIRSCSAAVGRRPEAQASGSSHAYRRDRVGVGQVEFLPIRGHPMNVEKITVRVTESGQTLEVVVLNKRAGQIEVVIGEGVHSVRCELTPTRTGMAYVGSIRGREIVYERSREQVQADIDRVNPTMREYTRRR